jgi:gluconokinase
MPDPLGHTLPPSGHGPASAPPRRDSAGSADAAVGAASPSRAALSRGQLASDPDLPAAARAAVQAAVQPRLPLIAQPLVQPLVQPLFQPPVRPVVVMGVAGCGKSSLAEALSQALHWPMIEGDAFHSAGSRARMQAGIALTDADRGAWLVALGEALAAQPAGAVLACSALKRSYRDTLRAAAPGLRFVFLDIRPGDAQQRVADRAGTHFFNPDLVNSQFETLEPPSDDEPDVLRLDATRSLSLLCSLAADWLMRNPSSPAAP